SSPTRPSLYTENRNERRFTMITRIALALFALTACALTQDFRATITGLVTDPNGAAVPHATVRVINIETNESKEAKTSAGGHYTIPYLNPGAYHVEVTASGFQTLRRENIALRVADKLNLPLQLTVGNVSETVTVAGQQETIESGSAERGLVFHPGKTQEPPHNRTPTHMLNAPPPGVHCTHEGSRPKGVSGTRGSRG